MNIETPVSNAEKVRQLTAEGKMPKEIAQTLGVEKSYVYRVRNALSKKIQRKKRLAKIQAKVSVKATAKVNEPKAEPSKAEPKVDQTERLAHAGHYIVHLEGRIKDLTTIIKYLEGRLENHLAASV